MEFWKTSRIMNGSREVRPGQAVLSVTDVTRRIKQALETGFAAVTVQGELSNVKLHSSGHLYFSLKDEGAQISGVMWRSKVGGLRFTPADGQNVVVTGRITVYEPRGSYQIDCATIRPAGIGELQAAFERLKQKLAAEGLFEKSRKKELPQFPQRIGIVTSPTGAALHDMLSILQRRWPGLDVILVPVRVQGSGAANEIARGLDDLNALGDVDVVIVGRGGGSLEDLWTFNEEPVARAIARSAIPVISAVGHETDFTIADFVADFRAPTPSAAAELAVRDRTAVVEILRTNWYHIHTSMRSMLESHTRTIRHLLGSYAFHRPVDLLRQHMQHLDELDRTMLTAVNHHVDLSRARLQELGHRIDALNPALVLRRGYAMVKKDGMLVTSSRPLHSGDRMEVLFHDGPVNTRVEEKGR
jgi:exodeoxyribonuclease VII large subunit